MKRIAFILPLLFLATPGLHATTLMPDTLIVTNTNDSGAGSLRQTVADAQAGDLILIDVNLGGQTIVLNSAVVIDKDLAINGLNGDTTVFCQNCTPLLLSGGATLTMETISVFSQAEQAIDVQDASTLTLDDVTVTAPNGPGIQGNDDNQTLTVRNSTIRANAFAILIFPTSTLNVEDSTIESDQVGIINGIQGATGSGNMTIHNSTVSSGNFPAVQFNSTGLLKVEAGSMISSQRRAIQATEGDVEIDGTTVDGSDDGLDFRGSGKSLTIRQSTITGGNNALYVENAANATIDIEKSTLTGGTGDGIHYQLAGNATVTITRSTITGSRGIGAFSASSLLSVIVSTVTGTSSTGIVTNLDLEVINSTVVGAGTGIFVEGGVTFLMYSSLVIAPTPIFGTVNDDGEFSQFYPDFAEARLSPVLQNNGSPTATYALCILPGVPHALCNGLSPAIDKGDTVEYGHLTDQREIPIIDPSFIPNRIFGDGRDVGAYEAEGMAPIARVNDPGNFNQCDDATCTFRGAVNASGVTDVFFDPDLTGMTIDVNSSLGFPNGRRVFGEDQDITINYTADVDQTVGTDVSYTDITILLNGMTYTLPAGASLNWNTGTNTTLGPGSVTLTGLGPVPPEMNNAGTVNRTGPVILDNVAVNNQSGGVWNENTAADVFTGPNIATYTNHPDGTFTKDSPGQSSWFPIFNQNGEVIVQQGEFFLGEGGDLSNGVNTLHDDAQMTLQDNTGATHADGFTATSGPATWPHCDAPAHAGKTEGGDPTGCGTLRINADLDGHFQLGECTAPAAGDKPAGKTLASHMEAPMVGGTFTGQMDVCTDVYAFVQGGTFDAATVNVYDRLDFAPAASVHLNNGTHVIYHNGAVGRHTSGSVNIGSNSIIEVRTGASYFEETSADYFNTGTPAGRFFVNGGSYYNDWPGQTSYISLDLEFLDAFLFYNLGEVFYSGGTYTATNTTFDQTNGGNLTYANGVGPLLDNVTYQTGPGTVLDFNTFTPTGNDISFGGIGQIRDLPPGTYRFVPSLDGSNTAQAKAATATGTLTLLSAFDFAGGTELKIDLAGPAQSDTLVVQGQATLTGGILTVSTNGFSPNPGDRFTIVTCTAGCTGTFTTENLPPGLSVDYTDPNAVVVEASAGAAPLVNATVMLAGPFDSGTMTTALNTGGLLPLAQPYNTAPWNYAGSETLAAVPPTMVDWVLVHLRTDPNGPNIATRAGVLLSSGSILDVNENALPFPGLANGTYYLVIEHRNHLAIMSTAAVPVNAAAPLYDFTTGAGQAFGTNAMVDVGGGVFGLWGGDGDKNNSTSAFDFLTVWLPANGGPAAYEQADFNMDTVPTAFDFLTVWLPANGQASQFPDPLAPPADPS